MTKLDYAHIKQFKYTSACNQSIRMHVFAHAGCVTPDLVSDGCCHFL